MRMAGVRDFRAHLTRYVSGDEPVLLTRHGKVSGLYLPLEDASHAYEIFQKKQDGAVKVLFQPGT